jgi:predicted membrane channel-forming protein YqfA (hemolysin III family)
VADANHIFTAHTPKLRHESKTAEKKEKEANRFDWSQIINIIAGSLIPVFCLDKWASMTVDIFKTIQTASKVMGSEVKAGSGNTFGFGVNAVQIGMQYLADHFQLQS